jgi:hypothetical protein
VSMERFARGSRGRGFPITNSHSAWYNILGQVSVKPVAALGEIDTAIGRARKRPTSNP